MPIPFKDFPPHLIALWLQFMPMYVGGTILTMYLFDAESCDPIDCIYRYCVQSDVFCSLVDLQLRKNLAFLRQCANFFFSVSHEAVCDVVQLFPSLMSQDYFHTDFSLIHPKLMIYPGQSLADALICSVADELHLHPFPVPQFQYYKQQCREMLLFRARRGDLHAAFYVHNLCEEFKLELDHITKKQIRSVIKNMKLPALSAPTIFYDVIGIIAYRLCEDKLARTILAYSTHPLYRDVAAAMTYRGDEKYARLRQFVRDDNSEPAALYLLAYSFDSKDDRMALLEEAAQRGFYEAYLRIGYIIRDRSDGDMSFLDHWQYVSQEPRAPLYIRVTAMKSIFEHYRQERNHAAQKRIISELIEMDADDGNMLLCENHHLWTTDFQPNILAIDPLFRAHYASLVERVGRP